MLKQGLLNLITWRILLGLIDFLLEVSIPWLLFYEVYEAVYISLSSYLVMLYIIALYYQDPGHQGPVVMEPGDGTARFTNPLYDIASNGTGTTHLPFDWIAQFQSILT